MRCLSVTSKRWCLGFVELASGVTFFHVFASPLLLSLPLDLDLGVGVGLDVGRLPAAFLLALLRERAPCVFELIDTRLFKLLGTDASSLARFLA